MCAPGTLWENLDARSLALAEVLQQKGAVKRGTQGQLSCCAPGEPCRPGQRPPPRPPHLPFVKASPFHALPPHVVASFHTYYALGVLRVAVTSGLKLGISSSVLAIKRQNDTVRTTLLNSRVAVPRSLFVSFTR